MVKVNNVSHILYPVNDLARSMEFLSKTLGFYVQQRGSTTYLGCGDTLLELVQAQEGREPATLYAVGLAVEHLDDALRELQSQGIEIVREPWNARTFWGRQAVIRDPGGANIALREWRAPDGPHFTGWHSD
jgi:predicted enzyme related to lactoylglutathione lyase